MNTKLIAIFLLLGALSSCEKTSTSGNNQSAPQSDAPTKAAALPDTAARQAESLDIYEATFRYLFQNNASGQKQKAGVYFLSIGDGSTTADPDESFMKRFADVKPAVKRGSECESSMDKGVIDKSSGIKGLLFSVGELKWISDTEVEMSGCYYEAGLSSAGYTYRLKKTSGKWAVEKETMGFIS